MSITKQQYCCPHFTNLIEGKVIITKEEAFPDYAKWKDQEFFQKHPKYIMWVENEDNIEDNGWHWFHFCPNCGFKHSTDEEIEYWNNKWYKPKTT